MTNVCPQGRQKPRPSIYMDIKPTLIRLFLMLQSASCGSNLHPFFHSNVLPPSISLRAATFGQHLLSIAHLTPFANLLDIALRLEPHRFGRQAQVDGARSHRFVAVPRLLRTCQSLKLRGRLCSGVPHDWSLLLQRFERRRQSVEMKINVGAVSTTQRQQPALHKHSNQNSLPFHADQLQISSKVSRV